MELHEHRKRAMREDVVRTRAARSIVLPINQKIAHWQVEAARLRAMSSRPGPPAETILRQAARLDAEVTGDLEQLRQVLNHSPAKSLEVGRVLDTVRALNSLSLCLNEVRQRLGQPDGTAERRSGGGRPRPIHLADGALPGQATPHGG
jgi:hypothetical protein